MCDDSYKFIDRRVIGYFNQYSMIYLVNGSKVTICLNNQNWDSQKNQNVVNLSFRNLAHLKVCEIANHSNKQDGLYLILEQ